ncbi:MAG: hypothetical protein DMF89_11220 [Acidobacteria bacterium]|nr:MAG: hypothetical protein DMF90_08275 [Acidobacteriota bacterium]PYR49846.1 MAG: hypothetical protein DMF89_11220 [Acidobacteriota bacterium]
MKEPQPVEVVGPLSAELVVATDAADTDFMVKLVDAGNSSSPDNQRMAYAGGISRRIGVTVPITRRSCGTV